MHVGLRQAVCFHLLGLVVGQQLDLVEALVDIGLVVEHLARGVRLLDEVSQHHRGDLVRLHSPIPRESCGVVRPVML